MSRSIIFGYDSTRLMCYIKGDVDIFKQVREKFSINNDQYQFQRRFSRYVPKRIYSITPTGRFYPGLFFSIKKYIDDNFKNITIAYNAKFQQVVKPAYSINDHASLQLDLREYQHDIVKKCLQIGRGVAILATAGGKTLTMACLIETIYKKHKNQSDFKCIVIVPTLNLVHQTYKDFIDYNVSFDVKKWTGNEPIDEHNTTVTIANTGILQSKKTNYEWVKYVDLLIVDEVHMLRKGNKINKLISNIVTPNKFGFTGTMPESLIDQWNIYGVIGPKLFEKNSKNLRDEEYIGKVNTTIIEITYKNTPEKCDNPNDRYRKELDFIINNTFRNKLIGKICSNANNNCLVMVDYIEHGKLVYEHIKQCDPDKQVYYIRGDVDIREREKIRQLMEEENNITIVAISKIFSTGINIKNLHFIVFAGGGKAKIKIIQSIGRGLRLHNGKKDLIIVDIMDRLKYGISHGEKRKNLYDEEQIKYTTKTLEEKT